MLPPHIVVWLEERHIGTPDGDPLPALQEGLLLLRAMHCHLEHPPEFPPERLERWKMIVSLLMDGGIEVTDIGLRMALFGDRKTLMTVLQCVYCLFHPPEGLNIPLNLEPEPAVHYPPLTVSLIEGASSYEELVDRIRMCLQVEFPERSAQEIGGQLLEELAQRLDCVAKYGKYEEFLQLVVGQMKSPIHAVSIRACGILTKLIGTIGPAAMLEQLISHGRSPKLAAVQDTLVSMLFADGSSPELLDFIHSTLVDLACPHSFRALVEGLLVPRLSASDVLHELTKLIEYSGVLASTEIPWMIQYVSERLQEAVNHRETEENERLEEMEASLVLFLRLWTELPDAVEGSGESGRVQALLMSPDGIQLCCRQVVLSELTSVVFVCPEIYDVLLNALEQVMKHTQLRRPLLRSLVKLHTTNTALSIVPLVELAARELHRVHCAIAEGDFVSSLAKHPQLSMVFTDTTSTWIDMMRQLLEAEPFMHTYACAAVSHLTGNMPDDPDLVSAVGFLVEDLLSTSEEHSHSTLLLHCVSKLHKAAPPAPQEHIHRTVFMFVQRLLRRLEEEKRQVDAEARERQLEEQHRKNEEMRKAREHAASEDQRQATAQSQSRQPVPAEGPSPQQQPVAEGKPVPAETSGSNATDDKIAVPPPATTGEEQKQQAAIGEQQQQPSADHKPVEDNKPAASAADQPAGATQQPEATSATTTPAATTQPAAEPSSAQAPPPKTPPPPAPAAAEKQPQPDPLGTTNPPELTPQQEEAQRQANERAQRRDVWLSALRQLCGELYIQFKKVPVQELDPPPPTPPPKVSRAVSEGNDSPRGRGEGEDGLREEDEALLAEDEYNLTSASVDQEDGMVNAQTFTTESSEAPRRVVNVKVQSKETLAKLNARKMQRYMDTTYMQPVMAKVFETIARREFKRMIQERGRISPDRRISATAKLTHEQRAANERGAREQEHRERTKRRDEAREKRDREIKRMLQQKAEQSEVDKTPASPKYFTDNLALTRRQETEERKAILAEDQKCFVELYRESRAHYKEVEAIDNRNRRLRDRDENMRDAQKRDLLKSKLNDYFDVKRQQDDLQKRNEWEKQMQDEFDRRLRFAKRSDNLKRKLLNWKLDQQDKEREEEQTRQRNAATALGPGGKPPAGRRLPPIQQAGDDANRAPRHRDTTPPPSHHSSRDEQRQRDDEEELKRREQRADSAPQARSTENSTNASPTAQQPERTNSQTQQQRQSRRTTPAEESHVAAKSPTPQDKPSEPKAQSKPPTPNQQQPARSESAAVQPPPPVQNEEQSQPTPQSRRATPLDAVRRTKPSTPAAATEKPASEETPPGQPAIPTSAAPQSQQQQQQQKPPTPSQGSTVAREDHQQGASAGGTQPARTSHPPTPVKSEKPPTAETTAPPVSHNKPASKPATPLSDHAAAHNGEAYVVVSEAERPTSAFPAPPPAGETNTAPEETSAQRAAEPSAPRPASKPPTPLQTQPPAAEPAAEPTVPPRQASKPPTPTCQENAADSNPPPASAAPGQTTKPPTPSQPAPTVTPGQSSKPPTPSQTPLGAASSQPAVEPAAATRQSSKPPTPAQTQKGSEAAAPPAAEPSAAASLRASKPATPMQERPAESMPPAAANEGAPPSSEMQPTGHQSKPSTPSPLGGPNQTAPAAPAAPVEPSKAASKPPTPHGSRPDATPDGSVTSAPPPPSESSKPPPRSEELAADTQPPSAINKPASKPPSKPPTPAQPPLAATVQDNAVTSPPPAPAAETTTAAGPVTKHEEL
jgi:hypothetical protein